MKSLLPRQYTGPDKVHTMITTLSAISRSEKRLTIHLKACVSGATLIAVTSMMLAIAQQASGGQQLADPDFKPRIEKPAYVSTHPLVVLDEAHANFHTASGRYKPFADLLRADGYRVVAGTELFSVRALGSAQVLAIANALGSGLTASNLNDPPSAFTDEECDGVRDWVRAGGALLLIADHAPFGATAAALAARFGVEMGKGIAWAVNSGSAEPDTLVFSRNNGGLATHAITQGVTRVVTFTGQSLSVPPGAVPLLTFYGAAYESPAGHVGADIAAVSQGKPTTARSLTGRAQGLAFDYGKGRVVMTGEAAMFSAQVIRSQDKQGKSTEFKMGMNVAGYDNQQFLLNILHWLTRFGE